MSQRNPVRILQDKVADRVESQSSNLQSYSRSQKNSKAYPLKIHKTLPATLQQYACEGEGRDAPTDVGDDAKQSLPGTKKTQQ